MAGSPVATVIVALPTVDGRESHLERAEHALHETVPPAVRLVIDVQKNRATCGEVWNTVAARAQAFATGSDGPVYLLCMADDLEPLPGWYAAAARHVEWGSTPSALIYTARAGQPDVVESHGDWGVRYPMPQVTSMSRIPFCRADQWIPIPPIHYFSDNAFSSAMTMQQIPIVAEPEFAFRHWWAAPGRKPMNDDQWFREQTAWQTWATGALLERAPRWS